jgi:hypothetical protein
VPAESGGGVSVRHSRPEGVLTGKGWDVEKLGFAKLEGRIQRVRSQ